MRGISATVELLVMNCELMEMIMMMMMIKHLTLTGRSGVHYAGPPYKSIGDFDRRQSSKIIRLVKKSALFEL